MLHEELIHPYRNQEQAKKEVAVHDSIIFKTPDMDKPKGGFVRNRKGNNIKVSVPNGMKREVVDVNLSEAVMYYSEMWNLPEWENAMQPESAVAALDITVNTFLKAYGGDLSALRVRSICKLDKPFDFFASGEEVLSGNYEEGNINPVIWDALVESWYIEDGVLVMTVYYGSPA